MEGGMIFATLKSAGLPYPGEDPSSPVHGRFDNKLSSFYCQTESRKGSLRMSVRLPSRRFPRDFVISSNKARTNHTLFLHRSGRSEGSSGVSHEPVRSQRDRVEAGSYQSTDGG